MGLSNKKLLLCFAIVAGFLPAATLASDDHDGYVLYAPLSSTSTYLVDGENQVAKEWPSSYKPGQSAYVLDDGSLLRAGMTNDTENFFAKIIAGLPDMPVPFNVGGVVERIAPDGTVDWTLEFFSNTLMPHHDVEILPNGNILMIAWELKSRDEAIAAGRDPKTVDDKGLWVDAIFEIEPIGANDGKVVWEWHAWDHLVQDFDPSKSNYGALADNPGKLNINLSQHLLLPADLMHTNSVSYNADLDQILLSSYNFSELYIIDHSTTTAEAATDKGGASGRGGEFLYRWGNPPAYGHSDTGAFLLGALHHPNWAGSNRRIVLFDNNVPNNSQLVEVLTPLQPDGSYGMLQEGFYGPVSPDFQTDLGFKEPVVGAAERLSWGAAFTCQCMDGRAIFIHPDGTIAAERPMAEAISIDEPAAFRLVYYPGDHSGVAAALDE